MYSSVQAIKPSLLARGGSSTPMVGSAILPSEGTAAQTYAERPPAQADPVQAPADPVQAQAVGYDRDRLTDRLLGLVSQRTGYPKDMLGLDVDLEASAMTNALPVRRIGLPVAARAAAPAAYVRAVSLAVERLEQTYVRAADEASWQRYDYAAPAFDFTARLVYDQAGLVLDYPGIAVRAA